MGHNWVTFSGPPSSPKSLDSDLTGESIVLAPSHRVSVPRGGKWQLWVSHLHECQNLHQSVHSLTQTTHKTRANFNIYRFFSEREPNHVYCIIWCGVCKNSQKIMNGSWIIMRGKYYKPPLVQARIQIGLTVQCLNALLWWDMAISHYVGLGMSQNVTNFATHVFKTVGTTYPPNYVVHVIGL